MPEPDSQPPPLDSPPDTPFQEALSRRLLAFIRARDILRGGEHILVAVSGGPDSTTLLLLLAGLRPHLDITLTVAHFDHLLRSRREAAQDRAFVRTLAESQAIPIVCGRGDVAARARRAHESLEEAARRLRYNFLGQRAKRTAADLVALGHTRDDRAESVLLHLLRGSGLDGLVGMRPVSPWPFGRGPTVARPLLALTHSDTERYCREAGVTPRRDPTNDLPDATRNRLRLEILPHLRWINPRVEEALDRLAEATATDVDYLEEATAAAWDRLAQRERVGVRFPRPEIAALPPALTVRLIRRATALLSSGPANLEMSHIRAVLATMNRRRGLVSLPQNLSATLDSRYLRIIKGKPLPQPGLPETTLPVPGRTRVGPWYVETEIVPAPALPQNAASLEAFLDADAVAAGLSVRSRRPGDRLRPLGLGGEKKLQDILVDAKVPLEQRSTVPLVCAEWGIAWIVGHRLDQRAAITPATRQAVHLRFRPLRGH